MSNKELLKFESVVDIKNGTFDESETIDQKAAAISRTARLGARGKNVKETIDSVVKSSTCPMNLLHNAHEAYDHCCSQIELTFEIVDGFYKGWIKLHCQSDSIVLSRDGGKAASIKAPFSFKIGE